MLSGPEYLYKLVILEHAKNESEENRVLLDILDKLNHSLPHLIATSTTKEVYKNLEAGIRPVLEACTKTEECEFPVNSSSL